MNGRAEKSLVVVVDDDRDFLEAVRLMLSPAYRVEGFSSGEDLPERLQALEPDLLILDMHMPGMSGVRLCEQVRAEPQFASLPILFLTASKEDMDFLMGIHAGADLYINKPIGQKELQSRVREALAGFSRKPAGR